MEESWQRLRPEFQGREALSVMDGVARQIACPEGQSPNSECSQVHIQVLRTLHLSEKRRNLAVSRRLNPVSHENSGIAGIFRRIYSALDSSLGRRFLSNLGKLHPSSSFLPYVSLLKLSMALNLASLVLIVLFIALPQTFISYDFDINGNLNGSLCNENFDGINFTSVDSAAECCSETYKNETSGRRSSATGGGFFQHLSNVLNGQGFVADSVMFYGRYLPKQKGEYDLPMAYFLTMASLFVVTLVALTILCTRLYVKDGMHVAKKRSCLNA